MRAMEFSPNDSVNYGCIESFPTEKKQQTADSRPHDKVYQIVISIVKEDWSNPTEFRHIASKDWCRAKFGCGIDET